MPNNIILTGMPKSGKSTLLAGLVEKILNKRGFLTREITIGEEDDTEGVGEEKKKERVGFEVVGDNGYTQRLAHVNFNFNQAHRVGRYGIFVVGFEAFINQQRFSEFSGEEILYIDEIGQMQLYSDKFKDLVRRCLDSDNLFLGTMTAVYHNYFIKEIRNRGDIEVFEVTPENREYVREKLEKLFDEFI